MVANAQAIKLKEHTLLIIHLKREQKIFCMVFTVKIPEPNNHF